MASPAPVVRAKAAESVEYPKPLVATMDAVCQPNPAGKILETVTSAVVEKRLKMLDVFAFATTGAVVVSVVVASDSRIGELWIRRLLCFHCSNADGTVTDCDDETRRACLATNEVPCTFKNERIAKDEIIVSFCPLARNIFRCKMATMARQGSNCFR